MPRRAGRFVAAFAGAAMALTALPASRTSLESELFAAGPAPDTASMRSYEDSGLEQLIRALRNPETLKAYIGRAVSVKGYIGLYFESAVQVPYPNSNGKFRYKPQRIGIYHLHPGPVDAEGYSGFPMLLIRDANGTDIGKLIKESGRRVRVSGTVKVATSGLTYTKNASNETSTHTVSVPYLESSQIEAAR